MPFGENSKKSKQIKITKNTWKYNKYLENHSKFKNSQNLIEFLEFNSFLLCYQ